MGAPTLYRYDDPGAPVFRAGRNGLRDILLGCLVNGYGDTNPAGWSVVYDDWENSGNISFVNDSESGILGLWHPGTSDNSNGPLMYAAEGMQSEFQPVNGRSGALSVSDLSTLTLSSAESGGGHFASYYRTTDGMRWVIVANENFAIVILERSYTGTGYLEGNPQAYFSPQHSVPDLLAFGAIDTEYGLGSGADAVLGNFFVLGGTFSRLLNYSVRWTSGDIPITHLRYRDGGIVTSFRYATISPYAGLDYAPDEADVLGIRAWRLYLRATATGAPFSGRDQYGRPPGLFGYDDIGRFRSNSECVKYAQNVDAWSGVVNIDGRDYVYGAVGDSNPVFISLSGDDW